MTGGPDSHREHGRGLLYGFAAYGCWGFIPVYFKILGDVPALELLCHRVVWALVLLVALAARTGLLPAVRDALRPGRTLALLTATTVLIAINWLVYIWAVVTNRILEGSLGYYINPLVNVLLGVVVLRERMNRPAAVAVGIAALGVTWLTVRTGTPPFIALTLAVTFGLYGLLRKVMGVGALVGLTVETALLLPPSLAYLGWLGSRGAFARGDLGQDVLLVLAGPITAVPLLFFAGAARRLPLTTLGFLQYLSPTLQFLLAVLFYGEPFTFDRAVAFAATWTAVALFAATRAR